MKGLTDRQQEILDFIQEFLGRKRMPPTVNEIAERFGITQPAAFGHMRALQNKGYIERSSKARSVTLMRGETPSHLSMALSIPVLGRISAGLPLLAEENREGKIQLDPSLLPHGVGSSRLFGLRVKGQSMIEAGILDGDLIIAREANTAEIGEIVVALVDGAEATVKKLFLAQDNQVDLRPCNSTMKSQFYPADIVRIQGVVISLIRKYEH